MKDTLSSVKELWMIMAARIITILLISELSCQQEGLTTPYFASLEEIKNVAGFGDAQHRGPQWYDFTSRSSESESNDRSLFSSSSSLSSESKISSSSSSDASSVETKEERRATRKYRTCIPCPHDMLKQYKNIGIKWVCAGYQRARRSFKSDCMMRYRNCQDGTMFVKLYDQRCKNDSYHGRHWFYYYSV